MIKNHSTLLLNFILLFLLALADIYVLPRNFNEFAISTGCLPTEAQNIHFTSEEVSAKTRLSTVLDLIKFKEKEDSSLFDWTNHGLETDSINILFPNWQHGNYETWVDNRYIQGASLPRKGSMFNKDAKAFLLVNGKDTIALFEETNHYTLMGTMVIDLANYSNDTSSLISILNKRWGNLYENSVWMFANARIEILNIKYNSSVKGCCLKIGYNQERDEIKEGYKLTLAKRRDYVKSQFEAAHKNGSLEFEKKMGMGLIAFPAEGFGIESFFFNFVVGCMLILILITDNTNFPHIIPLVTIIAYLLSIFLIYFKKQKIGWPLFILSFSYCTYKFGFVFTANLPILLLSFVVLALILLLLVARGIAAKVIQAIKGA